LTALLFFEKYILSGDEAPLQYSAPAIARSIEGSYGLALSSPTIIYGVKKAVQTASLDI
jgi:hypothetical protein